MVDWRRDLLDPPRMASLAFSDTTIYDIDTHQAVLAMPVTTRVSAYNSTSDRLVVQIGTGVQFFDMGANSPLGRASPFLAIGVLHPPWSSHGPTRPWRPDSPSSSAFRARSNGRTFPSAIAANTTGYTVSSLAPSQSYEFRIKADSGIQSSDWSNILAVTTTAPNPARCHDPHRPPSSPRTVPR